MNTTPTNKFFIVSLPRTGTKSLCKMVEMMGMKFSHVPSSALPRLLRQNEVDLFADTPIYAPSTFLPLVEDVNNKFIYIDRVLPDWLDSFERVGMPHNYMALRTGKIAPNCVNKIDRESLEEIFMNEDYSTEVAVHAYENHRMQVMDNIPSDRLLVYKFSDGWEPLAEFMGCTPPTDAVPHINKNTMYDVI